MDILRGTGASIDIVARNHVRPENFTGEVVWIKQPLDLKFKRLPSAKFDSGWYLLSNKTHQLILEAKRKPNLYAVVTRSQTHKTNPSRSREKERKVASAEVSAAVVTEDPTPLSLPLADNEDGKLVEVSGDELRKAHRDCPTLQACFLQAERENSEYRIEEEILFRNSKDHFGSISLQVVIPKVFLNKILALCHEGTSSHLGVRKTKDRLMKHYFWPNCIKEIGG
ncbi:hypothetical protein AVEN_74327-1 [Araneus ventricosus]|uniref:Integrase zinc-binding domain-containing protein n=1 Tax=Araneus ventricosus TaxID=182803 RepID=A0A4Y2HNT7_ARAVE|nr:hypothetical protein AVEN_74327-1 [Araneus ventricosus]